MRTTMFPNVIFLVVLICSLILSPKLFAHHWEFGLQDTYYNQAFAGEKVYLYYISDMTAPYRQGITDTSSYANVRCDIDENNLENPSWPSIHAGIYWLRVVNKYIKLDTGSGDGDLLVRFESTTSQFTIVENQRGGQLIGNTLTWTSAEESVMVDQKLEDGTTSVGSVQRFSSEQFSDMLPLGMRFDFVVGATQRFKADREIHSQERYHDWNGSSDVTNHKAFSISNQTSQLISYFKATHDSIRIGTDLIDVPGNPADSVRLKDPWLVDTNDTLFYESPYGYRNLGMNAPFKSEVSGFTFAASTKYKGVFLNQSGPAYNWNPPYYSVGAPDLDTINGCTSYFVNWYAHPDSAVLRSPDKDTSAVVFKIAGATVTALYKAHLRCPSGGLSSNNQRKVAGTTSGVYCIVYTTANRVWFTRHSGGAASPEYEVSSGSAYALNSAPSICVNGEIVNIVWQSTDTVHYEIPEGYYTKVHLRRYNAYSDTWGPVETVCSTVVPSLDFEVSPVIDASALSSSGETDMKVVVWRDADGLKAKQYKDGEWSEDYDVSGTDSASENPSIALSSASTYALAWVDVTNSAIRYLDIGTGGYLTFYNAYQVSPSYWGENRRPAVGVVNGTSVVAWESHGNITEGGTSVHIRKRPSGSWEAGITSFSHTGNVALCPVVGTVSGSYAYGVVWTFASNILRATWDGSSWSDPSIVVSSANEVNANQRGVGELETVWRTTSGGIDFGAYDPSFGKVSVAAITRDTSVVKLAYRLNRHAIVDLGAAVGDRQAFKGMVAFELAGLKLTGSLGEQKLSLSQCGMSSNAFVVSKVLPNLSVAGAIYGAMLQVPTTFASFSTEPLARVLVRDGKTDEVLRELWTVPFSSLSAIVNGSFGEYRELCADLSTLARREVYVNVELIGKGGEAEPVIVTDYLILKDQTAQLAKNDPGNSARSLPTVYWLYQNYPNPFNPATTIAFDLPEIQHVKLAPYNILGEEVRTLVNETIPAGPDGAAR